MMKPFKLSNQLYRQRNNFRSLIWFGLLLILGSSFLTGCQNSKPIVPDSGTKAIKVVMDNNYPPFVFTDENGALQGILIDQWRLWEQKTGIPVEITGLDWGEALRRMEAGEFDVIDTIFYSESRAKIYDFSQPYQTIDVPIYFDNTISGITDAESLRGFQVAVKANDAVIEFLAAKGIENLLIYNSYEAIIKAAVDHNVVVFSIDKPPADYFLHKYGLQKEFNSTEPLYSGQFHRAVLKGKTELLATIESGFARISKVELRNINLKWYGSPPVNPRYYIYAAIVMGSVLLVLLVLVVWNHALQANVRKKTKQIQESEQKFRQIYETAGIGISTVDEQGRFLTGNPAILQMLGYSLEEYTRFTIKDLTHPEDYIEDAKLNDELWSGKRDSFTYEKRSQHKEGHYIWGRVTSSIARDAKGKPLFPIRMFEDISDRKLAEFAQQESESRFHKLFENSPVSLWEEDFSEVKRFLDNLKINGVTNFKVYFENHPDEVASCVSRIKVLDVNNAALKLVHARSKTELFGSLQKIVNRDFQKTFIDELVNIASGLMEFEWEGFNTTLDGELINVAMRWAVVLGYEKDLSRVIVSLIDVTRNKKAEAALLASEENYRNLIDNIGEGVGIVNKNEIFSFANPRADEIFGMSKGTLVGRNVEDFLLPTSRGLLQEQTNKRKSGEYSVYELEIVRPDGEHRILQVSARPQMDSDGTFLGTFGIFHDITVRKMYESQLAFRSQFEGLLAQISTRFINFASGQMDTEINEALRLVGEFENLERGYVFRIDPIDKTMTNTHEWCKDGIEPQIKSIQRTLLSAMPWLFANLTDQPLIIDNVAKLPKAAALEKKIFESQSIQSLAVFPMQVNQKLIGFIGFDAVLSKREWKQDSTAVMQQFANILSNAFERSRLTDELEERATHDPLTGVLNRRGFSELAEIEIERAHRYHRPLAMILFDLDHLKNINDSFGHNAGDLAIQEVVKTCLANIRKIDILGRWGGDEFVLLLPESDEKAAILVADRLKKSLTEHSFTINEKLISLTISLGIATEGDIKLSLLELTHNADLALYDAKQAGRNCYRSYRETTKTG
jgi:diguanylate cyclase (GGDEF)-like protein/PAS domain S-box-containing protein